MNFKDKVFLTAIIAVLCVISAMFGSAYTAHQVNEALTAKEIVFCYEEDMIECNAQTPYHTINIDNYSLIYDNITLV